jgi:cytoskeleton protein RodZ
MSEDQDQAAEEATASEPEGPFGGERLAEARRERQISILEVAKELHLDEPKVRALEQNDFDKLGAAVFAKGHLRKYAELVGVDPDDILADYYKMTRTADLPPVVSTRPKLRQELSPGPWIAVAAVLLVAAVSYWWFVIRAESSTPPAAEPAAAQEETADSPEPAEEQAAEPVDDAEPSANDEESQAAREPAAEPAAEIQEPEQVADDGTTRLSLSFSGDCWTEISDADGRRLFFEMGRAGRAVELTGTAPISVLFGNVENVALRVNGADYPVVPANPGSRTARLTIVQP